jgi:hypothetical protein
MHQRDTRLAQMHTTSGMEWFLLPTGKPVTPEVAAKILARPDVVGGKDALFPGLDQTYALVRS